MNADIIIIGAGPGGYRAADYAARNGLSVVIVEEGEVGGTCLNRGCIPTKTMNHEASLFTAVASICLSAQMPFQKVSDRVGEVVAQLRSGVEQLMQQPGITLVRGRARIVSPTEVAVGETIVTASHVIIATGSRPMLPPIDGIATSGILTSDELLRIDHVPESLAIVGAGVIGMEFASIFARLGSKVTVIECMKECLPMLDSDIAKRLRKVLEKQGITFLMQTMVKRFERGRVFFERKGKEDCVEASDILIATGRKPNTDGLGLEDVGIAFDRKGIVTDDDFKTNVANVYAIGDVNGRQMLAHAAEMQGIHVVNKILGKADDIRFDIMPAAIFTEPEAACVGLSEDVAKQQGIDHECRKAYYRVNGKALSMNATEGMLKLIVSAADGRILGCHVYGAHASDIVQEVSALMCRNTTVAQLRDIIHIHPTLGEILHDAAM